MTNPPRVEIDAINSRGRGVRAIFTRTGDFYSHTICCLHAGRVTPLVKSFDESGAVWPWSPPIQQLHAQEHAERGTLLFTTGMAGSTHWSMSVSTTPLGEPQNPADTIGLLFDVAVRLKEQPARLGFAYQLCDGAKWIDMASLTIAVDEAAAIAIPTELSNSDSGVATTKLWAHHFKNSPERRGFVPPETTVDEFPSTLRWQYSVFCPLA